MVVHQDGNIDSNFFQSILNAYNNLGLDEKVIIYFMSSGGSSLINDVVLDLINKDPEAFQIVGYGNLCSAAFYLFFHAKCEKELMEGTVGMIHKDFYYDAPLTLDMKIRDDMKDDPRWKQGLTQLKQRIKDLRAIGLNDNEMDMFKQGRDVWFDYPAMRKFLKNQLKDAKVKDTTGVTKRAA